MVNAGWIGMLLKAVVLLGPIAAVVLGGAVLLSRVDASMDPHRTARQAIVKKADVPSAVTEPSRAQSR